MPPTIVDLAKRMLTQPVNVRIQSNSVSVDKIEQKVIFLQRDEKQESLRNIVTADDAEGSVPVFNLTQAWRVRIDHLPPGTEVWMCETRDGWEGIVFPSHPHQKFGDCGVSLPVEAPKTYHGPCKSGWINPKSVELIAG